MAYEVSTPVYEGPFDLLLHLITKEQVNLYEIRISAIVDAFLVEIERMQALDLEVATEFLLIAATLVELKLRRLLPDNSSVDLDEELGLLEERDLLLAKLLEYQTFRQAAAILRRMESAAARTFPRTNVTEDAFDGLTPDLLASVTPLQLRDAFVRAVTRAAIPKPVPRVVLDHVTEVRMTVAEMVNELALELPRRGVATFRDLVASDDPVEIIVHFLAVLELYKQGWIELDQAQSFGVMTITWQPDGPEAGGGAHIPIVAVGVAADGADIEVDPDDAEADALIDAALAMVRAEGRPAAGLLRADDYEG